MDFSHVLLIAVICLFVFGMGCLFVLYMMKRAAVSAVNAVVDKTLNKASDLVGQKVLDPTVAVATEGMRKGIDAVGQAVKQEYQETKRRSPANIDIEVTALARELKGKVTTADVTSRLKLSSKEAKDSFKRLKTVGECTESPQGHYLVYVFGAFLEKVRVWRCEYCSSRHSFDPGQDKCPACGGKLVQVEEVVE
jgi:rubrerythrin